ncbi:alpha/beta hydrolase [Nocardioides sp.]|jgi:acetyl esterase|uniref:alpha/beta hydrolase n=1 Tax=Nocardioides sp. TaxID=35761 RepID=UPI0031FE8560|nr:Alpha/beta hydrolase [Nocardioides sp.]
MPVDPGIATLLDLIKSSGYPPMCDGTPELGRQALRAMTVDPVQPHDVIAVGSVEDLEVAGRPARLYRPAGAAPFPTLVYLHGGGFVIGDLDTHDQLCRRICRDAEAVVLSVDYRLAPEAPFPAAVEDALAAVEWAAGHLTELGGNEMLAVGGDSAGGNLSAVVAQALPDKVRAQVLLYPATHVLGDYASRTDNAEGYYLELATMEWFFGHYVTGIDDLDADDIRLSPLLGDLAGVAPALVVTAEFDPLRDEGEAYAAKLHAAGVPVDRVRYDAMVHSFHDMGMLSPAAGVATEDVVARIRNLLHG